MKHGPAFTKAFDQWREVARLFLVHVVHRALEPCDGIDATFKAGQANFHAVMIEVTYNENAASFQVDNIMAVPIHELPRSDHCKPLQ